MTEKIVDDFAHFGGIPNLLTRLKSINQRLLYLSIHGKGCEIKTIREIEIWNNSMWKVVQVVSNFQFKSNLFTKFYWPYDLLRYVLPLFLEHKKHSATWKFRSQPTQIRFFLESNSFKCGTNFQQEEYNVTKKVPKKYYVQKQDEKIVQISKAKMHQKEIDAISFGFCRKTYIACRSVRLWHMWSTSTRMNPFDSFQ